MAGDCSGAGPHRTSRKPSIHRTSQQRLRAMFGDEDLEDLGCSIEVGLVGHLPLRTGCRDRRARSAAMAEGRVMSRRCSTSRDVSTGCSNARSTSWFAALRVASWTIVRYRSRSQDRGPAPLIQKKTAMIFQDAICPERKLESRGQLSRVRCWSRRFSAKSAGSKAPASTGPPCHSSRSAWSGCVGSTRTARRSA